MKKFTKNNIKVVVAFILGAILFGGSAYVLATTIASSSVAYTENGQATVEGALNDLYTKANRKITGDGITNFGFQTNTANTVFANSNGICIVRKGKLSCFKTNNWAEEQNHIQQVFSDISCSVDSSRVRCSASDFYCYVYASGDVSCSDRSDRSGCDVIVGGSVYCY